MKKNISLFGTVVLTALCIMGYKKFQIHQDLVKILRGNVLALKDFEPKNNVQKNWSGRLMCDFLDKSFSQVSIQLIIFKKQVEFDRHSRPSWGNNQLEFGFTLGNTMSRNNGSIDIIGNNCEVTFSNILRENRMEMDSKRQIQFCEANAPKVFALMQFQALRELELDGTYSSFDAKNLSLELIFADDQSKFIIRKGEQTLSACLGSKDVFVGSKKTTMKDPILMDENGIIKVTQEFIDIVSSLS